MDRLWRRGVLMLLDGVAAVVATVLAYQVRFPFDGILIPEPQFSLYLRWIPVQVVAQVVVCYFFGLYRQVWSYASLPELLRVAAAATFHSIVATIVLYSLPQQGFPRSVLVISWLLKIAMLGTMRLLLRVRRDWYARQAVSSAGAQRTLIYGAGDAGAMLAREYGKHAELNCVVIGFIDDDPRKQHFDIMGKPVLGDGKELADLVKKHQVSHLVIAMPSVKGSVLREVMEAARVLGLHVKTLPGLYELVNGTVSVNQIRDVQIEDILGREEVKVDLEAIAGYLRGEVVLVTGAGGSIGSELCRQVARFEPKQMLLLGHGENSIYEIDYELREMFPALDIRPIIADIQDETRIQNVFKRYGPGVVFHAAAHKHVPMMESNPEEAIKNNVFGTWNVARAADCYKARRFVLISSDKAVNPTSVMGATKRATEYIIQSLARESSTIFVAVRFGNVLGSRGSIVPLFKKQIAAGGPVTVTDERMVRYFMTIPEAVRLVIQSASMGAGSEVFLLDMGKPVPIVDLARDLIRLSGFEPDVDIPIVFTGIRAGEKLYEELLTADEGTLATRHERIYVAPGDSIPAPVLMDFLASMQQLSVSGQASNGRIKAALQEVLTKQRVYQAVGAGD